MQILLSHAKSTFQDGKFIVFLQFLDLILQHFEIQQFAISLQIEKLLIFILKKTRPKTLCINVLQVLFADAKSTCRCRNWQIYSRALRRW